MTDLAEKLGSILVDSPGCCVMFPPFAALYAMYTYFSSNNERWFTVFRDKKTPDPFVENLEALGDDGESVEAALPNHVYMDAMGFGMGCCCLQLTFQACNINEARTLYDQLTPLCPIMVSIINRRMYLYCLHPDVSHYIVLL
jgi:hypothetical protein